MTGKGIIDTVKLHKGSNTKLFLLRNAEPMQIYHSAKPSKPVIENMDRFTLDYDPCDECL